ncbi:MAG TPA: NAD-dependent epimerase/dehydratase family protein [Candidatus Paceibacterota bacterium]|nr:NAD-dependent epimerase/dehydratase family protein [Candidatus Paceibacterota bacterium]
MGKLVVVTGGAGFVGSHLCERLVADGHKVISLDNYFTGKHENEVAGVEYREGHTKDIATLVPETPDLIYHLGEYSRVAESMNEPGLVWDFNIVGTAAVLEFCREKKCKIVYAGSSTKFADARDDGTAGRDLSPYTWSKAVNTELVRNYGLWYDVPYAITYFYNVYGPRELSGRYGTVVEIFNQNRKNGEPHKVNAPGTQTRAYTHVKDTVEALVLIGAEGRGDEYGIGTEDVYSALEVAELFGGEVLMMPARRTSRPSAHVDAEKVKALGWKPSWTLKEYIRSITQ